MRPITFCKKNRRGVIAFARNQSGAIALEMGFVAPILIFAFILMADLGIAVGERMNLDRWVRAGVQATMSNVNEPSEIKDFVLASTDGVADVDVTVGKTCKCGDVAISCTSWCSPGDPPSVFIDINAIKPYSGFLLPAFDLESRTHVQLR